MRVRISSVSDKFGGTVSKHFERHLRFNFDSPGSLVHTVSDAVLNLYRNSIFGRVLETGPWKTFQNREKNVFLTMRLLNAFWHAKNSKEKNMIIHGLTGESGGKLSKECSCINIPSNETPRIQECHILIGHLLCQIAEEGVFKSKGLGVLLTGSESCKIDDSIMI